MLEAALLRPESQATPLNIAVFTHDRTLTGLHLNKVVLFAT